jgi:hypothetical protein
MSAEQLYDSMLVLTRGEVDDAPLTANSNKWQSYSASIDKLLSGDAKELVSLGDATAAAEQAFLDSRSEVRKLRTLLAEAKDDGVRKEISAKMRDAQTKADEAQKNRYPLANMAGEMSMMMAEEDGKNARGREGAARNNARASELPAPFNPGTLIREFGGSDRTVPSSGDTVPTVPQALALLNDPNTDIIGTKRSALGQRLAALKTPEERLDAVFLRLYSRAPTPREKERFGPLAKDTTTLRDLTRAMVTSNQFIFVP